MLQYEEIICDFCLFCMEREIEIKSEPMRAPEPELVDIGDGSIAHKINHQSASFDLSNMFESQAYLGGDKFTRVFFRTKDNNIYCLDNGGNLVDVFESEKKGKIIEDRLSKELLKNKELSIGRVFEYGENKTTEEIVEIIPTTANRYAQNQEYIDEITDGRKNKILEEFEDRIERFKYNMDPANPNYTRTWIGPEGAVSYVMTPEEKRYILENKEGPLLNYLKHKELKLRSYLFNNLSEKDFDKLQALNFQDEKRENPPIGTIFSPQSELKKIRALSKEERKEALRIFKDKLIRQRKGLSSCRLFLEKNIEFDNDVLFGTKLHDLVDKFGKEYGFDDEQHSILHNIILEFRNGRRNVLKTRESFSDDYELVEHLTGVKLNPNEKLEISIGPASIDIKTNSTVAGRLYSRSENESAVETSSFGGFATEFYADHNSGYPSPVNYTVVIEEYEKDKNKIITHEHEHVKNRVQQRYFDLEAPKDATIFLFDYNNVYIDNPEVKKVLLEDFCNRQRLYALERTKDEIIATLSASSVQELQSDLSYLFFGNETPFYDWFSNVKNALNESLQNDTMVKTVIQGLIFDKYKSTVENAIRAYEDLISNGGYSNQQANALLIDKPLYRWPGTIKRILKYDEKVKNAKSH